MGELYERIKSDIQTDKYYQQNYVNDGVRFLAWYLRNCYSRTPIQARNDITDGPNDKEFDAVIVDDEKRQIITIQSKFYASSVDHEPLQEVLAAWLQIQNLSALQENCNDKLKVKLEAVGEALQDDYEVVFELVTTGQLTGQATNDLAAFQSTISEFEHPTSSLTLVDSDLIQTRWSEATGRDLPKLSHTMKLEPGRYLALDMANFRTVIAAIRLSDCLKLPGIADGKLFRKNVRQSLGLTNKVNKGLKQTIMGETPQYFFLYHNGITALCEKLTLDTTSNELKLDGLAVVNGCQSLNTILACSEKIKTANDARVLFRFYEIPQRDLADKISIFTNSQSAVKARDLRSNDKRVLALKRAYENFFPNGYMITKRGEERPANKDAAQTIDVSVLANALMTWHSQRPNMTNNENRLFDKYFDLLFRSDYLPVDIAALNIWTQRIEDRWKKGDLGLNEALSSTQSLSKWHLLFAIQSCFSAASNQIDKVPAPSATMEAKEFDRIVTLAANSFNAALDAGVAEYTEKNKIFSPQNWLKARDSVLKLQASVRMSISLISSMTGGPELKKSLYISPERFGLRWAAD